MISKQKIKDIHSLRLKKYRDQSGLFVGEGRKAVRELLQTFECAYIAATQDWIDNNRHLISNSTSFDIVSEGELAKASLVETPQQVVGVFRKRDAALPEAEVLKSQLCLALDTVQDPGNIGTIVRLARWFGIDRIVCSLECADVYSPKVVQATMGALGKVNIGYTDLPQFLGALPKDVPVYGTFLDGENIYDTSLTNHGVIVMGNEGNGISAAVAQKISQRLYIPPYPAGTPAIESLNVGVAAAIVCAEFRRRQSTAFYL